MASKHGKVAICISGLIRTGIPAYPIFQHFFGELEADIFYHTWNTWNPNQIDSHNSKLQAIESLYKPVRKKISDPLTAEQSGSFGSMLYGIMMANELKKSYEIENDFRYDLVIKTRFDLVFPTTNKFPDSPIEKRTIYCPGGGDGFAHTDYESHGINDVMFWGESDAMDIATNVYMHYRHNCLTANQRFIQKHIFDPADTYYSVNNMIYDYAIKRNIHFVKYHTRIGEVPWRDDVAFLDPMTDYDKIRDRYQQI